MQRLDGAQFELARGLVGRAFYDYNLMEYAQPNDRRRGPAVTTLYGALVWDCLVRGEVYVSPEFTGLSAWLAPGTGLPSFWQQARAGMLVLPLGFGLRGFRRLTAYDDVARRLHHQYAPEPHWYLSVVAVEPSQQGRGIGSALMRPMLERADAERKACWLDTHQEQNVRLYKRHGFDVAEEGTVKGHSIPVFGMLRKPR